MFYYKYTEILNSNNVSFRLDKANYRSSVEEYLYSHSPMNGAGMYIVIADLSEEDNIVFLKQQRVTMEVITENEFNNLKISSPDYIEKRQVTKNVRNNELNNAVVIYRGVAYDANENSINRMMSKIVYYNYRFNLVFSNGSTKEKAFEVYNDIITWIASDKSEQKLTIKDLINIYEMAITKVETLMFKYSR